jgi:predicted dehydrogenase
MRGCQVIAENGTLEWEMNTGKIFYYKKSKKTPEEVFSLNPNYDFNDTYISELINFIDIINNKNEKKVNIEEAVDTMKVLEAIKTSSEKKKWVWLKR